MSSERYLAHCRKVCQEGCGQGRVRYISDDDKWWHEGDRGCRDFLCLAPTESEFADMGWARVEELEKAAQELANKIELVERHPLYLSVFTHYLIHGCVYAGPTWEKELSALKQALAPKER